MRATNGFDRLELDAQPDGVAERAVRIRERAEEVGVLVARRRDDLAGTGEDVHLETDSCGIPLRNDADSMPRPVTAPPSVMVLSCGTTSGASPKGSVAATRSS